MGSVWLKDVDLELRLLAELAKLHDDGDNHKKISEKDVVEGQSVLRQLKSDDLFLKLSPLGLSKKLTSIRRHLKKYKKCYALRLLQKSPQSLTSFKPFKNYHSYFSWLKKNIQLNKLSLKDIFHALKIPKKEALHSDPLDDARKLIPLILEAKRDPFSINQGKLKLYLSTASSSISSSLRHEKSAVLRCWYYLLKNLPRLMKPGYLDAVLVFLVKNIYEEVFGIPLSKMKFNKVEELKKILPPKLKLNPKASKLILRLLKGSNRLLVITCLFQLMHSYDVHKLNAFFDSLVRLDEVEVSQTLSKNIRKHYPRVSAKDSLLAHTLYALAFPGLLHQGKNPICYSTVKIMFDAQENWETLIEHLLQVLKEQSLSVNVYRREFVSDVSTTLNAYGNLDALSLTLAPHYDSLYRQIHRYTFEKKISRHEAFQVFFNQKLPSVMDSYLFSGKLDVYAKRFFNKFAASYHPNVHPEINQKLPLPVSISLAPGRRHAVLIQRIIPDRNKAGRYRVYFYDPSPNRRQIFENKFAKPIKTYGHNERLGESSMDFEDFVYFVDTFFYQPEWM